MTNLYQDGALVTAVAGRAVGWIDDGRLLVNKFALSGGRYPVPTFAGAELRDPSGALLASPPLPQLDGIQTVSATSVYCPGRNAIYSLDTGAALWTGPSMSGAGAVAGGRVVYPFGAYVLSEPY